MARSKILLRKGKRAIGQKLTGFWQFVLGLRNGKITEIFFQNYIIKDNYLKIIFES